MAKNKRIEQLNAKRQQLYNRIKGIADAFNKNGKRFESAAQATEWETVNKAYDATMAKLQRAKTADDLPTRMAEIENAARQPINPRHIGFEDGEPGFPGGRAIGGHNAAGGGMLFEDARTGRPIRALLANEPMASALRSHDDEDADPEQTVRLGAVVAALALNDHSLLTRGERNALHTGSDDNGGYLLSPQVGTRLIDLARSASVAMKAGAQTLPMNAGEMQLVRVATDPVAGWRREMQETKSTTMTFNKITLRSKMLSCIVPISLELIEDAANVVAVVEQVMQSAMGLALDKAVLFGTGTEAEPLGIVNQLGVNEVAAVGTASDYSKVTQGVGKVLTANYPGEISALSWVAHPREGELYDKLEDSTGQPLQPTPWASKLKRFYTTSLSITQGAGAESSSIVGDFSQVLVGMRTRGAMIQVFDAGHVQDTAGKETNAVSQYVRFIRAYLRADVALIQPTWLCKLTGQTIV